MLWACMLISSIDFGDGCWGNLDQQILFRFENFKFYAKENKEVPILFR